jgi:single-stranded-DNA-specific exonuclease
MAMKQWVVPATDHARAQAFARALGVSPLAARVLLGRGIESPQAARAFLEPRMADLADPFALPGMREAVAAVRSALRARARIGIYGDYDVDGISGTAILADLLRLFGAHVETYVPHRLAEGYGLHRAGLDALAERGVRLLITVDCGTSSPQEVAYARSRGMDVVVVDHHLPGARLPEAIVVNPMLGAGAAAGAAFREFASAGVALKLALALCRGTHTSETMAQALSKFALRAMAFAALGTIADVCPLTGENRVIVRYGLDGLRACGHAGLRALLEAARVDPGRVTPWDVAFRIAPRLNAVGRMGSASDALKVLLCADEEEAAALVRRLEEANRRRQREGARVYEQARARAQEVRDAPAIVLGEEGWHVGVLGIVAARLVGEFARPVAVAGFDGPIGRGSVRAPEPFHAKRLLERCGAALVEGGGHERAGGFVIERDRFGEFARAFCGAAAEQAREGVPEPELRLDGEVRLKELSAGAVRELERLGPFGEGNPEVLLAARGLRVLGRPQLVGRAQDTVAFLVEQDGVALRAVAFGRPEWWEPLAASESCALAFTPRIDAYRSRGPGREEVELKVADVRFR